MVKKKSSFFEKVEAEVISSAKSYVGNSIKENVKKKIFRFGEISISFFIGFLLLILGIVNLIGYYYPSLDNGLNYLLVGILFIFIGLILKF